jgi:CRISPR-associated protein Csb2
MATARWQGYLKPAGESQTPHSLFDPRLIVLRRIGGERRFGLGGAQVPNLADALRKTLIAAAEATGSVIAKAILSGHAADGTPAETPHAAYLPLADVGHGHADGHLLGLAIALPRGISRAAEDACFGALAHALQPADNSLCLKCGAAGTMVVAYDDRDDVLRAKTLRPESWCAAAVRWATATPIVLDRLPPRRHADPDAWAATQIAQACARIGLPMPSEIRILPVSCLTGTPAAREFVPLPRKDGARRWHVHAELHFPAPVEGPVLLGAGRYRGYGLCKPLAKEGE